MRSRETPNWAAITARVHGSSAKSRCRERLEAEIGNLNDRERAILGQRLLAEEPCTLVVIAAQFGVSRERIRQIEAELMVKLRVILQQVAV